MRDEEDECCQSRGRRLWPLSVAAGGCPCGSLAIRGILGLKEHTRSLCGLCMGSCSQSSAQLYYCLMSEHAGQISCLQAKPQWACSMHVPNVSIPGRLVLSLKNGIYIAALNKATLHWLNSFFCLFQDPKKSLQSKSAV